MTYLTPNHLGSTLVPQAALIRAITPCHNARHVCSPALFLW